MKIVVARWVQGVVSGRDGWLTMGDRELKTTVNKMDAHCGPAGSNWFRWVERPLPM